LALVGCVVLESPTIGCAAKEGPLLVIQHNKNDASLDSDDASEAGPQSPVRSGMRLQYQLDGTLDETADAELFVIDLFEISNRQVERLHTQGRVVVAYVAAGSYEPWRPDAEGFPNAALGQPLRDHPEERWVDIRDETVRSILIARLVSAADKGFDGVLMTSIDAYQVDNGFDLDASDQLDYNLWLAAQAHDHSLFVGLSGDWNQGKELAPAYDFAIHIGCIEENRCD